MNNQMSSAYTWFVEPLNSATNAVISQMISFEDACFDKECGDGKKRNLWRCQDHSVVTRLKREVKCFKLRFNIWCQRGRGAIRYWSPPKSHHQKKNKKEQNGEQKEKVPF